MKNKDDNKIKKNETLSDTDLDKVAGGVVPNIEKNGVCHCNNRVVKEIHSYQNVLYQCQNCGGYIPSNQIK
jgi:hypothetical protein